MKNRMLKVIIALFLLVAMSNVTLASDTNETYCRSCHGNTVDRHHLLTASGRYQCMDCHATKYDPQNQTYYTEVIRNCLTCHPNQNHNNCISCHSNDTGNYPAINATLFGKHINVNTTDGGPGNLTSSDCRTCHYDSSNMSNVLTYSCIYCHNQGNFSAPMIQNHQPDGVNIKTAAYCSICHKNSINKYAYSENASVGHYGTNTMLLKPTVNQTAAPRFGFATDAEALDYNKDCNNCHNPSNTAYGNATQIDNAHTSTAICNQCHLVNNANNLHNVSLRIPGNYSCRNCHTNAAIASQFGAPDVTGTGKENLGTCANCHGGGDEYFDSLADHNMDRTYPSGKGGSTDTVYLNSQPSLTVTKGAIVTITSKVNDSSGTASKVGGAEYYIDNDPGKGRGIPMNAMDGSYDAAKGKWENVTATIDTSGLASGIYIVNVRGLDIGKQWSLVKNATLTVQSFSYINGTVTNASVPVPGVYVSTTGASYTTGPDGKYSLRVSEGNYVVNAVKRPEFYDYAVTGVIVSPSNTTIRDINIIRKPNGTISGVVSN